MARDIVLVILDTPRPPLTRFGQGLLFQRDIARDRRSISPPEVSPQAVTVCPTAKMFNAAFLSLGLREPQLGQTHY